MPVSWERSIFKTGGSHRVNIPTPILKALNLKNGDKLTIWLDDHRIIMQASKKRGR